jgi:uncharacterized membrane protein YhaH (DUF805 family)
MWGKAAMGGQGLGELLFSSAGRVSRGPFLIVAAALTALGLALHALIPQNLQWLGWLVDLPLLYMGACVTAKRLHDRGRTGWWAALVLGALVGFLVRIQGFFAFFFLIVLVWALVELGLIAGEQGSNRFGPSPSRPIAA